MHWLKLQEIRSPYKKLSQKCVSLTECRYKHAVILLFVISYLFIGFRNKAGDTAVSIQKLLKLCVADDKPLSLSQGFLSCIFAINQQTLEYLTTRRTDKEDEYIW